MGMGSANERRRYIVTSSLIGWAHNQKEYWNCVLYLIHWGLMTFYFHLFLPHNPLENDSQADIRQDGGQEVPFTRPAPPRRGVRVPDEAEHFPGDDCAHESSAHGDLDVHVDLR